VLDATDRISAEGQRGGLPGLGAAGAGGGFFPKGE
jgi:hypothetical protein